MSRTLRMDRDGQPRPGPEDDAEATQVAPGAKLLRKPRARRCPTCAQPFSGEARFCPFDGDPLVDAPDWNPGADALLGQTVDGRYEVLKVLGEGGMGTVYEVRHTTLDRHFAMKVLRRDIGDEPDTTERFIREARAAASIGHPNIVAVNDFGEIAADQTPAGGRRRVPYFVMELLSGKTLGAVLKQEKTLSARRGARILLQCASALSAAHAAGVLHRDLKPDNIFLTESGGREFVKLLDFGVAKIAGTGRLTQAGRVFGTPHYMSPEQAGGHEIDHRADVYALGVILYECLAGRVPFEADTYMGVLTQHLFAVPVPLERVAPDPRKLGALGPIAMRCLAKQPEDRYDDMEQLAEAVELSLASPREAAAAAIRPDLTPHEPLRLREPSFARRSPASQPLPLAPLIAPKWIVVAAAGALAVTALLAARSYDAAPDPKAAVAQPDAVAAAMSIPPVALPIAVPSAASPVVTVTAVAPGPSALVAGPVAAPTSRPKAASTRPVKAPPKPQKPPSTSSEVVDPWGAR